MRLTCTWTLVAALGILCVAPAWAQIRGDAVFQELKTHASLGADDDPILDQWLSDRVDELATSLQGGNNNNFAQVEQNLWGIIQALFGQEARVQGS